MVDAADFELAQHIGTSVELVRAVLRQLEAEMIVSTSGSAITLLVPGDLDALAAGRIGGGLSVAAPD